MENFLKEIPENILVKSHTLKMDVPYPKCNEKINDVLNQTVLLGGKRLRPLLTFLFGELFEVEKRLLDICAQSIEMVHGASLAHDDVIDNASLRRGSESINIVSSNKKAVLAGDYLLASVITNLSKNTNLLLVQEMSKVIMELSEGEWLQLEAIDEKQYTQELIETIAIKKTSSVMSWCSTAPAILSKQSEDVIELCRLFGKHLGIGFQLLDDTLDFGDNSKKDTHLDVENGVISSVYLEWLIKHPHEFKKFKEGEQFSNLFNSDLIEECVDIIKHRALNHLEICQNILIDISKSSEINDLEERIKPIRFIIDFIGKREH